MHRLALAVLVVCLVGCVEGAKPLKLAPVTGTVTKGGKALKDIRVTLAPVDEGTAAPFLTGLSDADGKFTIQTGTGDKGATPGRYKVVLTDGAPTKTSDYSSGAGGPPKAPSADSEVIPSAYQSSATTPITVTVDASSGATINAEIK